MSIQELGTDQQAQVEMITCVIDGFEITVEHFQNHKPLAPFRLKMEWLLKLN